MIVDRKTNESYGISELVFALDALAIFSSTSSPPLALLVPA